MSNLGWSGGCLINLTCWTVFKGLQSLRSPLHRKGEVSGSRGSQGGSLEGQGGGGKGQSSMSEPNLSRNGQFDFSRSEFGSSVFL